MSTERAEAFVLACRYCGGPLLADGEGGWSCPERDRHIDAKRGPREIPSSPDGAARALAGIDREYADAYRNIRLFLWNRFNGALISGEQREFIWNLLTNFPEVERDGV